LAIFFVSDIEQFDDSPPRLDVTEAMHNTNHVCHGPKAGDFAELIYGQCKVGLAEILVGCALEIVVEGALFCDCDARAIPNTPTTYTLVSSDVTESGQKLKPSKPRKRLTVYGSSRSQHG
jgi:hypothetical protein